MMVIECGPPHELHSTSNKNARASDVKSKTTGKAQSTSLRRALLSLRLLRPQWFSLSFSLHPHPPATPAVNRGIQVRMVAMNVCVCTLGNNVFAILTLLW